MSNERSTLTKEAKRVFFDAHCERIDSVLCNLDEFADDFSVRVAVRELQLAYHKLAIAVENMDDREAQEIAKS